MFFQSIYQMMSAGTDLSINIRRMDGNLSVVVMPRRTGMKEETGQSIVPLVLNGTPVELDGQFMQAVTTPLQKAQGILVNLENFEKQAQQATAQKKAVGTVNDKESKEVREKREKIEKLLKKSDEAVTAGKYSEATMWLKQARALATPDKQKEIDTQIQEVQKKATEGSLFAEAAPQEQSMQEQPVIIPQQPPVNGMADGQMQMFPSQPTVPQPGQQPIPQPVYQPASQPVLQPLPQPQIMQPQPVQQAYQPEMQQPQPMYGQYYQQPANGFSGQPQMYIQQPGGQPQPMQQWQYSQPIPQQPQAPVMQTVSGNSGREYHSQPQPAESLCFDKDDDSDRERLREDPYSEYLDFPEEYRMKDEAQMELVCC